MGYPDVKPGSPQQDAFLQDARLHVRMTNGPEQDGWKLFQFGQHAVRQGLARPQVSRAADVVMGEIQFEIELLRGRFEDFYGLGDDLGTGAITTDDCNFV